MVGMDTGDVPMSEFGDERGQEEKHAASSKVNIVAFIILVVNVLTIWEIFPQETLDKVQLTVNIIGPVAVIYFRTFMTNVAALRLRWESRNDRT